MSQKITPFLWFNNNAEEAMNFYGTVFKDFAIKGVSRCGDSGPGPKGSVSTASFTLFGQQFTALNGGPHYQFTPAISFVVHCIDQTEMDYYWSALSAGGKEMQCGWITDQFGLSWQIVPDLLIQLFSRGEPEKSSRMMKALMTMKKIDCAKLQSAFDGN